MELQHRIARQMINIAISKAMEDMRDNGNVKRSIRNIIDLGLFFSKTENQLCFFDMAKKVVTNPKNPYYALVTRMIDDVDNDTIKKVGLNLGYSSLNYGANKLKRNQEALGFSLPWLLLFDDSESDHYFLHELEQCVREGQELGIYSYIICPNEPDGIPVICEIAKQYEACLFVLKVPSIFISKQTSETIAATHNIVTSVQIGDAGFNGTSEADAFRLLRQNHCLYGFHVGYNEETIKQLTKPEYIRSAIGFGNIFGTYIAENSVSNVCQDTVHTFACKVRGENGQPLIAFEWNRDIQYIGGKIFYNIDHIDVNLAERVYCEYIKTKDMLTKSLLEILRSMQLCTNM